jgi:hypothetical protein
MCGKSRAELPRHNCSSKMSRQQAKGGSFGAQYASAAAQQQGSGSGGGSFDDEYDSAGQNQQEGSDDEQSEQEQPLTISADDVAQMEQLKQSGDMKGLGEFVAKLLD